MSKAFEHLTKEELKELWRTLSDERIAQRYGVSKSQVKNKRRECGITPITLAVEDAWEAMMQGDDPKKEEDP